MSKIAFTSDLKVFRDFALNGNNSADQAVQIDFYGNVGKAANTASAVSRFFAFTDNAQAAKRINLNVRTAFLDALKRHFNAKEYGNLPDYIKDALVGTHADTWNEDFDIKDGVVQSTKPLTVRRIRAVFAAIEEHVGQPAANSQNVTNPVLLETDSNKLDRIVKERAEKLGGCFDELAEKLTSDVPDPVDKERVHDHMYPERYLPLLKNYLSKLIPIFAKVGTVNNATGKRITLNQAKERLRKAMAGEVGVIHGYWGAGSLNKSVVYCGKTMQNRVAFKLLVDDLVNDFVNDFNAKYPELALADE